jgi:glyoxylase-like metal-dependent hydrolase (beta-lactamase superfamily II)
MLTSEVAEGIHWLEHAHVNVYFVEQQGRVMIVDSGLPAIWPRIRAALRELGFENSVTALVLTHGHFDHVGVAARLRNSYRIPILVHPDDAYIAAHPYRYKHELNRLAVPLQNPGSLPILGRMTMAGALWVRGVTDTLPLVPGIASNLPGSPEVYHVPGHTAGHIALHFPDRRALIVGDAFVTLNPYTGMKGPQIVSGAATANSPQALDSLDRIAALTADKVLTGHGEPWLSSPADAVAIARKIGPT